MIENPEQLCDFYFELSNEDRLRILNLLTKKPMKLTNLAKSLDISNQECSRHLQRLTEADIIDKNTEGNYELTNYGSISLILQENQRFITEYREYFNEHNVLGLPREYLSRIGELSMAVMAYSSPAGPRPGSDRRRSPRPAPPARHWVPPSGRRSALARSSVSRSPAAPPGATSRR